VCCSLSELIKKNQMLYKYRLHFISIVTLDILLTLSNFSTTCQLTVIRVLVDCQVRVRVQVRRISLLVVAKLLIVSRISVGGPTI